MRGTPPAEGRRWLEQAEIDLTWAQHLSDQGAYHLACFLAQQVAEKALKAFLYSRGADIVLGHSVERLCAEASEAEPSFAEGCARWSALDGFYVPTRYPNALPDSIPARVFTRSAAEEAVGHAREVVEAVRGRMKAG